MPTLELALIVALAILLIAVVVLLVVLSRRKKAAEALVAAHGAALVEREEASVAALEERERTHTEAISVITADGQKLVAEAADATSAAEKKQADAEAEAEFLRKTIANSMGWDRVTRDDIVRALSPVGGGSAASGFVATNVVFRPVESGLDNGFSAQIDHVIVTTEGILIVESKNWQGVVFNSVHPRSVHADLGALFEMAVPSEQVRALTAPYAIRVSKPSGISAVTFNIHAGIDSPTKQVQRQALRLNALLKKDTHVSNWIDTIVYFSHRAGTVHSERTDDRTIIVRSERDLKDTLTQWRTTDRATLRRDEIEKIATLFQKLGADVQGVGRDMNTWVSVIPWRR